MKQKLTNSQANFKRVSGTFRGLFFLAAFTILQTLFYSCTTGAGTFPELTDEMFIPQSFAWQETSPGISTFTFQNKDIPLTYHIVRIQFDGQEAEIFVGANPDSAAKTLSTRDFAKKTASSAAINTAPFSRDFLFKTEIVGFHRAAGKDFAQAQERYAALAFLTEEPQEDNTARVISAKIFTSQNSVEKEFSYVFGGFFTILQDSVPVEFKHSSYNSRSAAGTTADGKTLYLLAVEGENPSKSIGLSYPQCARIFLAAGCTDAMQFDGGGSTELCINGNSVLTYRVFRKQAASLGLFSRQK